MKNEKLKIPPLETPSKKSPPRGRAIPSATNPANPENRRQLSKVAESCRHPPTSPDNPRQPSPPPGTGTARRAPSRAFLSSFIIHHSSFFSALSPQPLALLSLLLLSIALIAAKPAQSLRDARAVLGGTNPLLLADSPLEVLADRTVIDNATSLWRGIGNVTVSNSTHVLHADTVTVNFQTGDVSATGNITFNRPNSGQWHGDQLHYNFITRAGMIGPSEFKGSGVTIQTQAILSNTNGVLTTRDTRFTTCTNAPGHWHYWLHASDLTYNDGKSASMKHASAWFLGIPVAYFPFWYRDLDTSYGIRLTPGYSSDWGGYLLGSYLYKLNLTGNPDETLRGRFNLDYRWKRGLGVGNDFTWHSQRFGIGGLSLYYLDDRDAPRYGAFEPSRALRRVDSQRHRIAFQNILTPTDHDRIIAKVETLSDSRLLYDFYEDNFRNYYQPDNLLSYTRRQDSFAAGITVAGPVDSFYDGMARLPEAWFSLPATPLLPGLYYETQTRLGYHRSALSDWTRDTGAQNFNSLRLDTHHRLSYPIHLIDKIALVPRAAYRGTWYSHTSRLDPSTLRHTPVNRSGMRNLYELGVEASTRFYGTFNEGRLLHILQPYLDYSFTPSSKDLNDRSLPGNHGNYAYGFDRYDNYREWRDLFGFDGHAPVSQWHGFRLGARNTIMTGSDAQRRRTLIDADLYAAYIIDHDAADTGWGLLGTRTRFAPLRNLLINLNADYDPRAGRMRYLNASLDFVSDPFTLTAGWLRRDDPLFADTFHDANGAGILYGEFTHVLSDIWTWGLEARYNTKEQHIDEVAATLSYSLDCMTFQLRTAYEPSYTTRAGIRESADYKISFLLRLHSPGSNKPPETDLNARTPSGASATVTGW